MSDIKARADWTDRELLVYILSAMEHSNVKLDYTNAPVPVGRNVSGCVQRVNRLKKALKNDMDALKNGLPVSDTVATGKGNGTKGKNKRKAGSGDGDADGDEEKPKKRGRAKKTVEPEVEGEVDAEVKQEATPESEGLGEEVEV